MSLWNGNRAALSLTFDDGLPCQIEYALPLMNQFDIPGTFFLIPNSTYDRRFKTDVWKAAIAKGHEIGSHSMNHKKAANLTVADAEFEAGESKKFLDKALDYNVTSFCYPFTDAIPVIQNAVRKHYRQARGGRVARPDKFVCKGDGLNFMDVPCFHVNHGQLENIRIWIDAALERNAWVTLMFHGVGPDDTQWDNVREEAFKEMLDIMNDARSRGLWVATFGDAAASLRANG